MNRKIQAKHISEIPILEFLEGLNGTWATWFPVKNEDGSFSKNSVMNAVPSGTPEKVILSKMRSLIRRGLVDGCGCGCRGDFVLSEKGKEYLKKLQSPLTNPHFNAINTEMSNDQSPENSPSLEQWLNDTVKAFQEQDSDAQKKVLAEILTENLQLRESVKYLVQKSESVEALLWVIVASSGGSLGVDKAKMEKIPLGYCIKTEEKEGKLKVLALARMPENGKAEEHSSIIDPSETVITPSPEDEEKEFEVKGERNRIIRP